MYRVILMMLLAVVSGSAMAEWVKFYASKDIAIYIDLTTIRNEGGRVKVWTLANLVKPKNISGGSYKSIMAQSEHDCLEGQERSLSGAYYSENMGKGFAFSKQSAPGNWKPVHTKNVLWNIACVDMSGNTMVMWIGMHVDYLVASLGQPLHSTPLSDGGRLLEYRSEQTAGTTDNDISTPNLEALQNDLKNNNEAITQLNEQMLNQYNAISNVQQDNSITGALQQTLLLPDLQAGLTQLSEQRGQLINANNQILRQLNLEQQMAMNSRKQQVRSCSKLFTVSLQGNIIDARCL